MAEIDDGTFEYEGETMKYTIDDGLKVSGGTYPPYYLDDPVTGVVMRADSADGLAFALNAVRGQWLAFERVYPNPDERRSAVSKELTSLTKSFNDRFQFFAFN